jgi:hypothetical protein
LIFLNKGREKLNKTSLNFDKYCDEQLCVKVDHITIADALVSYLTFAMLLLKQKENL